MWLVKVIVKNYSLRDPQAEQRTVTGLLLPFARRRLDGLMVEPYQVPRGFACECDCPGCGRTVQARQGTEKVWHFAHAKAGGCIDGYERSVHELAKQLLRDRKELLLPALEVVANGTDRFGRQIEERERVFDCKLVRLEACKVAVRVGDVTADILGQLKGRDVLVEVTVHHRLMPDKEERLLATKIPSIEIDLSRFKVTQASREKVEEALFDDPENRRWLFHPKRFAAQSAAEARLKTRSSEHARPSEAVPRRKGVNSFGRQSTEFIPIRGTGPIWRASFPDAGDIRRAQVGLAERTGTSLMAVVRVTNQISGRSSLSAYSPEELASRLAEELSVSPDELMKFFEDGLYTLC